MEPLPDLPPKVPEELADLDRALQRLGADVAAELKKSLEPSTDPRKPTTQTLAPSAESAPAVIVSPLACEPITPEAPALPSLPAGPKHSAPPEKRLPPNDRDLPSEDQWGE